MRIRNPPKFIMSISVIMSLIMTLLVFQCGGEGDEVSRVSNDDHDNSGHNSGNSGHNEHDNSTARQRRWRLAAYLLRPRATHMRSLVV